MVSSGACDGRSCGVSDIAHIVGSCGVGCCVNDIAHIVGSYSMRYGIV